MGRLSLVPIPLREGLGEGIPSLIGSRQALPVSDYGLPHNFCRATHPDTPKWPLAEEKR